MPRANRRRDDVRPLAVGGLGHLQSQETHPDGVWIVRRLLGRGGAATYRCPGCEQLFPGSVPHVVAWPAHGLRGPDDRRHWHTPCWRTRGRTTPRRSSR